MYRWIWSYIRKYRGIYALGLFFSVLVAATSVINPSITGQIVDRVIIGGENQLLAKLVGAMLLVTVIKSILRFSYQSIFEIVSQNVIKNVRMDLYNHIQTLDFSWYDKTASGNIMTLMTSDLDAVRHFVAWVVYQFMENVLTYVFSIVVLSMINIKLTAAFLVIAPFMFYLILQFRKHIKKSHLAVRDQFAVLNTLVGENIAGNRVVKAFVREDYEISNFDKENEEFRNRNIDNANVRIKYLPLMESITGLLPIILILFGGYLVIKGHMTLGEIVTFNGLLWTFTQPLNMFGGIMNDAQRFSASAQRLYEIYQQKPSIKNCENPICPGSRAKGKIQFNNVSFAYKETPVLQNVSFTAEPGMTIGILGPTGAGKSTIAKLMCRYYDVTEGEILLDGEDIRKYDLQTLRRNVGITMQDVFLFSDTVEGNIAFGKPDAPMELVEKAADRAHVTDFLKDLTDGYDTIVGERGVGLSGGQKQRIALARLFLMDPPVMILDDTTSAVDVETEQKIRASIREQAAGHTAFIISHRVSSIQDADMILVIEDGKITQCGKHAELSVQNGYYKQVWDHQEGRA